MMVESIGSAQISVRGVMISPARVSLNSTIDSISSRSLFLDDAFGLADLHQRLKIVGCRRLFLRANPASQLRPAFAVPWRVTGGGEGPVKNGRDDVNRPDDRQKKQKRTLGDCCGR